MGRKWIHLGFVDCYFVYPTSPTLSNRLYYIVVKLPGMDDLLVRERHDVLGWHYHYCDRQKRRSDTLMSFDQGRVAKAPFPSNNNITPLCWEAHAVKKAKFAAKPWRWGDTKRRSIYVACEPDLAIHPPLKFKPPSKEALDVWPAPARAAV
jgi:hypothetical protein